MSACRVFSCFVVALASSVGMAQQSDSQRAAWNQPVEPFTIIGNVHYVGAAGVSAFLITTTSGSILLDGGLPETAPLIAQNIETLGFKVADVKYLLNSHAHFDHAGGLAELRRRSKADVVASAQDAGALRAGGPAMPAVEVDRIIKSGDTVTLGSATVVAHVTAGHTKGCTTWTTTVSEGGRQYTVLFHCSTSVVDRLVDNAAYPDIVNDYERTFAALRSMKADVFLGAHPMFFDLEAKRARRTAGGPNPFVDPSELGRFVERSEQQFRAELKKQRSEAPSSEARRRRARRSGAGHGAPASDGVGESEGRSPSDLSSDEL
jgi:metallo-beta-lactamase class B